MDAYSQLSNRLSWILDTLGFSSKQRQFRIDSYNAFDEIAKSCIGKGFIFNIKTSGSKGEGLTRCYESDTDILYTYKDVVCVEDEYSGCFNSKVFNIFTLQSEDCVPGYTRLELKSSVDTLSDQLFDSLIYRQEYGTYFLSTTKFLEVHNQLVKKNATSDSLVHDVQGPSIPTTRGSFAIDRVFTLRCVCPTILKKWSTRHRRYTWPSTALIDDIDYNQGNLVATSHKSSSCKDFEWRYCFNFAELKLMHSLNDTLTKLYVLLKMVTTDILEPKNKEITSYMLKNIIFWLAESYPEGLFREETLFSWLLKTLIVLRRAIKTNFLPYYMIPERNLLEVQLSSHRRRRLTSRLSALLRMGPCFLAHCHRISAAIRMSPDQMFYTGEARNLMEMLKMLKDNYYLSIKAESMEERNALAAKDDLFVTLGKHLYDLASPDWRKLPGSKADVFKRVNAYIETLLC